MLSFLTRQRRFKVSRHFKQSCRTLVLHVLLEAGDSCYRGEDGNLCNARVRGDIYRRVRVPILSGNSPGGSARASESRGWKNCLGRPSDSRLKISSTERGNSLLAKIVPRKDFCFTSTDSLGCKSGVGEVYKILIGGTSNTCIQSHAYL
jgi:hypothetical protein